MHNANAYNAYKNANVNYVSKEKLLLMLLDGAVNFSKMARQAILDKNVQKAHDNIIKTENIFYELMNSLDVDRGGEWAKVLMDVYDFIIYRLIQANIKKNIDIMNEIIPIIEDLRDTWNEAYRLSKNPKE